MRRTPPTVWPPAPRESRSCEPPPTVWPPAPRASRSCEPPPTQGRSVRLSQVGELGLLAELERRGLAQRIENDAAQVGEGLVITQDALVEDVHFRFGTLSWRELGFRAAAVNLSDLAASGAEPE